MKKIFIIGNIALVMINFRREFIMTLSKYNEVYCLACDYDDISKKQILDFGAIPLDYNLNSRGMNPLKDIFHTIALTKLIKYYKPDIVISFMVKPVIFGTIAAKLAGTRRIIGMIEGLGNAFTVHKRQNAVQNTNRQIYSSYFI